ncbi:hypothetical protein TNCV_4163561 [Trichonephila clavipes]|nr:hypothetical protein TNCV_4163561 [Trichonephila clavipes]
MNNFLCLKGRGSRVCSWSRTRGRLCRIAGSKPSPTKDLRVKGLMQVKSVEAQIPSLVWHGRRYPHDRAGVGRYLSHCSCKVNRLEYIKLYCRNSNLGHHTGQANAVRGINADQIRCSQLASLDKNNALREIKLRLSYLQGKSTTMSVIAHQTEKEWISANKKIRQRMSQTQAEGAAEQHADRLEDAHLRAHHSCFTTSEIC